MSTPSKLTAERRPPPPGPITFEEFLEWCDEDTHAEWVDGEVVLMSPVDDRHNDLGRFLIAMLSVWIEDGNLGVLRYEPALMRLSGVRQSGRSPDILFVAREHLGRVKRTYIAGPADLAIELVSRESRQRDEVDKYREYEVAGVREYWQLDRERQRARFYELGANGRYQLAFEGSTGIYRSKVLPGFWLDIEWLWQDPLPKVVDVLKRIGFSF